MKIDILDRNRITLFVSAEELTERGFTREDHTKNVEVLNEIVDEVLEFAISMHDFEVERPIITEATYVPEEGTYILITATDSVDRDIVCLRTQKESLRSNETLLAFRDFEDVVNAVKRMPDIPQLESRLYHYRNQYLLYLARPDEMDTEAFYNIVAVLSEYAQPVKLTIPVIEEYGKTVMPQQALAVILSHFG